MGLLSNGLETLEVGATAWRLIINSNLEKLYSRTEAASTFLAKAGGTLTGFLTLHANPTANLHAATKEYVDTVASGIVTSSAVATFTNKTLDDITNIVGADHVHYKVKNQTGSTIAKGVLVKAISYETGEESIRVAPCSSASDVAIGITEAAITSGSYGLAINTGVISGLDTGTYAVNTILYNNGLGGLTATKPTSGMYQACAVVIRQQQVTGALLVEFTEPGKVNWDDRYYTETEIDAIMGAAGLLPSQTGHTGHYLRTDGTAAYWDSVTFDPGDETIAGIKTFTSPPVVDGRQVSTGQRKNYLINGNFDMWQYGTSQTSSGYGSDDRWANLNVGSTKTHSMVNATDTERALFSASKFSRTVVSSVVGVSNYVIKLQYVENVTKLAGKTVTISFWAKADSNKNIAIKLAQSFGTGGTPSATVDGIGTQLVALTTTWQKKTITVTLPSIIGKTLGVDGVHTTTTGITFAFDMGSTYNTAYSSLGQQSGTFDIAQVKLEDGAVATDGWHPYDGEFGGEVQACQRYYQKYESCIVEAGLNVYSYSLCTAMRITPSITGGGAGFSATGFTNGNPYGYFAQSARGTHNLALSAEL